MKLKYALWLALPALFLGLASCATEKERQVVLPESEESDLPWNSMREGEGLGQFGAFQNR
ncbi:hypothetical protein [Roseibacillus ishigakijimensis]|uniref:Uncharacterized protein n=1 Tax=Roseibacillus ishigakijimensis TaxID=454146 RepID=A0A934RMJ3_9BACT|nr:hypothetical protein [Roseibacillus ishigakijimensis]MBK1834547.1 hypothetical protein [Roseibacillus ishigakijimensis]